MAGAQHRFRVVTMPAGARRLNDSSTNKRIRILCGKSIHALHKQKRHVPKPSLTLKNGFPTLKIGGGGSPTPRPKPTSCPYTLVDTLQ